ncbi:MAG: hypothetical protein ACLGG0_13930 [Bacteriovoracia bacterium]
MRSIIAISLVLLVSACSPRGRGPAQFQQTDEVLINVGIPLKAIEREVQKLASKSPISKSKMLNNSRMHLIKISLLTVLSGTLMKAI